MKTLTFRTVSPLFEQERDGTKPFTTRKVDNKDSRFKALAQWKPSSNWAINIVHPPTGGNFTRRLLYIGYFYDGDGFLLQPEWLILYLGDLI